MAAAVFPHVLQVETRAGDPDLTVERKDDEHEALEKIFLPANLLEPLNFGLDQVLNLAALLAPGVQQPTENIRRSPLIPMDKWCCY